MGEESGSELLEIIETPLLADPVLLLAMDGWIDASGAARVARQHILDGEHGRRIDRFDTDRLLDHRARRPTLHLVDGVSGRLEWPTLDVFLFESTAAHDVL